MPRRLLPLLAALCCVVSTFADPLSKKIDIDFFRDVPSRSLKGLATRSDGRLVGGPKLTDLTAAGLPELLWCLEPAAAPDRFLVGTGPDGRIFELTLKLADGSTAVRELAKLEDPQVFALKRLPDGSVLAGTSPRGGLYLLREGKTVARVRLPADSIFDLLALDAQTVLVATGNPGRIYRLDLRTFADSGTAAEKPADSSQLAARGLTLFGEIRDRNVRRLAALADGRFVAGSSPKGNLYTFPAAGGAPVILQENREAEVTDLLPQPNGDLYATIVFSGTSGDARITPGAVRAVPATGEAITIPIAPLTPAAQIEKFGGRSTLVFFPAKGYPETLSSRSGVAFYRLARYGNTLLLAGGDTGDIAGYDLDSRFGLTFPGSISAQLNGLAAIGPGRFLLLRNNAPGLAVLDFQAAGPREAETKRIDLGTAAQLGALRFNRVRAIDESALKLELRVSNGSDEVEGWGPWTSLALSSDGGWRAAALRGRNARIRLQLPAAPAPAANAPAGRDPVELDRASLFVLPQNRRPQLQEFHVLSPGYGLIVANEPTPSVSTTLNQLTQTAPRDDDTKPRNSFLNSQVVPQPGAQVVFWNVTDPDTDNFTCTFSLRRDGETTWTDIVTNTRDSYAQFDVSHLPDGLYFTRLVVTETAPRPTAERLTHTFETDDLVVDHTPPEMLEATARRNGDTIIITVHGRDALSLLDGIQANFSNGVQETVQHPIDGVRDGREETFTYEVPVARVSNATSVEVTLFDSLGNTTSRRLTWTP
ncbi:hypothetical protein [Opitutus sp. ER46]|uniref:hypothetical protein n=1 Tax=Opitutus sp. ER46 TaxID=2161864 RepID=UPI000D323CDD|nr:hypothetical protein [Opitutus sp. ER46]PTX94433.1 hypothetical protein DB354_11850 [Opitutus sp. ER46]